MLSVEESYEHAFALTRAEAKNFFYAFRFLPRPKRLAVCTIYAFSRRCDDTVDAVEEADVPPEAARAGLEYLGSFLGPEPPDDPLVPALRHTLETYAIDRGPLDDLIAGMEMDLTKKEYATFEELYRYCYHAASVIGLVCIEIFGYESTKAPELAVKLGIAMQLTNILRDVKEDLDRGRIYLPGEELSRFRYSRQDLGRGTVNDSFRDLMRFQVTRARDYFRQAEALFPLIQADARYCPVLLMRFYSRILDVIERQNYDVLRSRPRLRWHEKFGLALSLWARSRATRWGLHSPIQKEVT